MTGVFWGRLGLQQRVLPDYRASFVDLLAERCQGGLGVFTGQPLPSERISSAKSLSVAVWHLARNRHFLSPDSNFFMCWQQGLVSWLQSWQPEVLIVEANPRYLSTRAAIDWMHKQQRAVLGWGLGAPQVRGWMEAFRTWERRSFIYSLDGLLVYSSRGREEYIQMGFPAERVFVASNAVVPRPIQMPPEKLAAFKGKPKLLFVGRLQARKRLDLLIKACTALPFELQPELWVVGDGPAREALATLAYQYYPNTQFYGEHRGAELEILFQTADLFVLPGTGGLAVQQAMSFGLPVVVARGDGSQEDLVKPANGWLIPPDDLDALVAALKEAFQDVSRLRRKGWESYRIVAEQVNLETMVDTFVNAVNTVRIKL